MSTIKPRCTGKEIHLLMLTSAVFCLPALASVTQKVQKFNYAPEVVTLTGIITPKVFPGPPNYESVARGDTPEREWILNLQHPIELAAENGNDAETNVKSIELVMGYSKNGNADPAVTVKSQYKMWKPLTQKGVTVLATGTLFHSFTAHHHTNILMEVRSLQRKP